MMRYFGVCKRDFLLSDCLILSKSISEDNGRAIVVLNIVIKNVIETLFLKAFQG